MPERAIQIVDYDPLWPATFSLLKRHVLESFGSLALSVEHVGSTAVPNLAAKPIIDMVVVVRRPTDVAFAIERLEQIGYIHEGDLDIPGREAFKPPSGLPYHHLYLCTKESMELRRQLFFRDYLRKNPDVARQYGELKRDIARRLADDRQAYSDAKSPFIERILSKM